MYLSVAERDSPPPPPFEESSHACVRVPLRATSRGFAAPLLLSEMYITNNARSPRSSLRIPADERAGHRSPRGYKLIREKIDGTSTLEISANHARPTVRVCALCKCERAAPRSSRTLFRYFHAAASCKPENALSPDEHDSLHSYAIN